MKKILLTISIAIAAVFLVRCGYYMVCNATYKPQQGDVIFHVSESSQSAAIKIGTLSRYSHCGVVIMKNGKPYVLEAENGVELTPMKQWIKRGIMLHHYRVMRLKDKEELKLPYKHLLGMPYDKYFRFDNGRYYCSELVWEMYKKNDIILCEPNPLKEYHFLGIKEVQKHVKNRGLKMDQLVVPPSDLIHSEELKTVSYGYGNPFWL